MSYGTVTIGRLVLREALTSATEQTDAAGNTQVAITGQEACPPHTPVELASMRDDIRGLAGMLLPVQWTDKSDLDGYWMVSGPSAELWNYQQEVITLAWSMTLTRVGSDSEVDVESRLSGPLTRTNAYSAVGERWHAPPIGHTSYWTGPTVPSTMLRTGADGTQTVYRGVPLVINPRYSCPLEAFPAGRARFLDDTGRERSGVNLPLPIAGWEVNNGLVRLRWDNVGMRTASYDSTAWEQKTFLVSAAGAVLGSPGRVTLLRNDYELVTVRLLWSRAPVGRVTVDLTVRRGSRLVEGYIQTLPAATVAVGLAAPVASSATSGYVTAAADDPSGNRYLIATAGAATASTVTCSLTKASAAAMDFAVGQVIGGGSAVSGDGAAALYQQYLGSPSETVRTIRR